MQRYPQCWRARTPRNTSGDHIMINAGSHGTARPGDDGEGWVEIDPTSGLLRCPWCGESKDLDFHSVSDDDKYEKRADTTHTGQASFEQRPVHIHCYSCDSDWLVPPHCRLAPRARAV